MKLCVEFINELTEIMSLMFFKLLFSIGGMPDIYTCLFCVLVFLVLKRSVKYYPLIN